MEPLEPDPTEEAMKQGHSFGHTPHHHTGHLPSPGMSFPLDPEHDPNSNIQPPPVNP